jgi:hypothetical protein
MEEAVHFRVDRKQRVRKKLGARHNLQGHTLVTYFF